MKNISVKKIVSRFVNGQNHFGYTTVGFIREILTLGVSEPIILR